MSRAHDLLVTSLYGHTILLTRAGSRCYGIHNETSDLDIKGVAIPPVGITLGIEGFEQVDSPERFKDQRFIDLLSEEEQAVVKATKLEGSIYDFRKFVRLALDNNPNILDVLFCRDEDVLLWGPGPEGDTDWVQMKGAPAYRVTPDRASTPWSLDQIAALQPFGYRLREVRGLFLSAKCLHTFSGYAMAQLKRINTHKRWLLHPVTHKPTRAEYNLPESTLIPADQLAAAEAMVRKEIDSWELDLSRVPDDSSRIAIMNKLHESMTLIMATVKEDEAAVKYRAAARAVGIDDNLLAVMERERTYKAKKTEWDNYESWKAHRNPDRAALEEKYGYDTKHGAHLVRLMRMCREILVDGKVNVWRGDIDADEIKAIRKGAWSYEKLIAFAEAEEKSLMELYKAGKYVVPKAPDREKVNDFVVSMLKSHIARAG